MLYTLLEKLNQESTLIDKINVLDGIDKIETYLQKKPQLEEALQTLPLECEYVIKVIIAINQADNLLSNLNTANYLPKLKKFTKNLYEIEKFYENIGGLLGYHLTFLKLIKNKKHSNKNIRFHHPQYLDIQESTPVVKKLIDQGLESLSKIAIICPMGGAGDRLGLINQTTKEPLPTAKLEFLGMTLLENIIQDIQALEYYYFIRTHKIITIPVVIMTSDSKNNHKHIVSICEKNKWFHRNKENFYFVKQMSVPLITEDGNWTLKGPLDLATKPSGHGVIWKLLSENGILDELISKKISKAILRQINNPIAFTDYSLLAFLGASANKAFGFAACPRIVKAAEGVNVLKEKKLPIGFEYNLTNIEYTDFDFYNIKDEAENNSNYSKYPSNTNILFADLTAIKSALKKCEFPGLTVNLKNKVFTKDKSGNAKKISAGRLESAMQNIADYITDYKEWKIKPDEQKYLKTYLTYNKRQKTISTIKKSFHFGSSLLETPEGCFYDIMNNYYDLLKNYCKTKLPPLVSTDKYLTTGFPFHCYIHPTVGPLYSIIAKKIKHCELKKGSELIINLAEVHLDNLFLNGSLIIETPLIKNFNEEKIHNTKCFLENVKVNNLGIDTTQNNNYWKNQIYRKEFLKIILHEKAIFYAKNINFSKNQTIEVPPNCKMIAIEEAGIIKLKTTKLS